MSEGAFLYIVRCRDGSLYIGTTRSSLETRIAQHNAGTFPGYTASRRPVELVFSQCFDRITDAIAAERSSALILRRPQRGRLEGWMQHVKPLFKAATAYFAISNGIIRLAFPS